MVRSVPGFTGRDWWLYTYVCGDFIGWVSSVEQATTLLWGIFMLSLPGIIIGKAGKDSPSWQRGG